MKTATAGAFAGLLLASTALAEVKLRVPLSMSECGQGCSVSAYYDTDRGAGTRDYQCGGRVYGQHDGVDIAIGGFAAMDAGRPVVAAAPGVVIAAHDGEFDRCTTANCGTANYVQVKHADGKITWYWHLRKWSVRVKVGQQVACGEVLGLAGSSGLSTGPHVHFGVQDPAFGIDDPFASSNGCGGTISWWVNQGPYLGLPGAVCQNAPPPPPPPPSGGEIIIDSNNNKNDPSRARLDVSSNWTPSASTAGFYGTGYYYASTQAVSDAASFNFFAAQAGPRTVDAWWTAGTNRSAAATFVMTDAAGNRIGSAAVDQRQNGGKWVTLGTFNFTAGWNKVQLSRWSAAGAVVIADAVRVR